MVAAQGYQVVIVQTSVVVLLDWCDVMHLHRLAVQCCQCVVSVPQAYLTQVSVSLPYLYAFVCPLLCLAEPVTLSVPGLLPCLSVRANVTFINNTAHLTGF